MVDVLLSFTETFNHNMKRQIKAGVKYKTGFHSAYSPNQKNHAISMVEGDILK